MRLGRLEQFEGSGFSPVTTESLLPSSQLSTNDSLLNVQISPWSHRTALEQLNMQWSHHAPLSCPKTRQRSPGLHENQAAFSPREKTLPSSTTSSLGTALYAHLHTHTQAQMQSLTVGQVSKSHSNLDSYAVLTKLLQP